MCTKRKLLNLMLLLFLWLIVIKVSQRRIEISPPDTAHELLFESQIVILQKLNIASQLSILLLKQPVVFCQFRDLLLQNLLSLSFYFVVLLKLFLR